MNKNNIALGAAVVAIVIATVSLLSGHASPQPQPRAKGIAAQSTNYDAVGVTSLFIGTNCNSYATVLGGGCVGQLVNPTAIMTSGSTTPATITSPAATSTLLAASCVITTATSTATIWTIATSTNAFSTSSPLAQYTVPANAQASFAWDPSVSWSTGGTAINSASSSLGVLAPSTPIVFSVQGGVGSGTNGVVTGGRCNALMMTI